MLYDQRWDAKTKADPFTLPPFVAWLEKQPAKTQYDYMGRYCVICQYLTAHGEDWVRYSQFLTVDDRTVIAAGHPRTFGAALTRARAVLTEKAGG